MQITSSSAIQQLQMQQAQAQKQATGAREKFNPLMRGGMTTPSSSGATAARTTRSIPAHFQNMQGPTILGAAPQGGSSVTMTASLTVGPGAAPGGAAAPAAAAAGGTVGSASAGSHPQAFSKLSQQQAGEIWYGGNEAHGASVKGIYSEKASYGGQVGIGHPNYATTATGEDMVISVTGLHGKNPQPTQVMALDSDAVMRANGGVWPGTPAEMQRVLKNNPEVIVADVQASPPQMARITGVPPGTKVTMLVGAEGIMANPPRTPAPSQAMVTNISQLSSKAQALVPKEALMAGGTEAMMKAQAELMAQQMAQQAAENAARANAERMAAESAARTAGQGAAQSAAERHMAETQTAASVSRGASSMRGGPPVPAPMGNMRGGAAGQAPAATKSSSGQPSLEEQMMIGDDGGTGLDAMLGGMG
jgi:hypothetical protein